jgi:hypothetical protein
MTNLLKITCTIEQETAKAILILVDEYDNAIYVQSKMARAPMLLVCNEGTSAFDNLEFE